MPDTDGCAGGPEPGAVLRPFSEDDHLIVGREIAADPVASRILGFYATQASRWAALQHPDRRTFWVDVLPDGPVGFVEIEVLDGGSRATFSVYVSERFRGRRNGVRALMALIDWTRANTRAVEIESDTELENTASIRTLERAGFARGAESAGRVTFRLDLERCSY